MDLMNILNKLNAIGGNQSAQVTTEAPVADDSMLDAIQPVLNFAMSQGYTVKRGSRKNSVNFLYDLGMGDEVVLNAQVYHDKDLGETWVNFEGMGMSGSDPANVFLGTFKQNHQDVMDEVAAEKESRDEEKLYHEDVNEGELEEGPEIFKLKADQARRRGEDTFTVGGKTYPVKGKGEKVEEATEPCEKCGEVHTGACKEENLKECDMGTMAPGMEQAAPDRYTLSIMRGDKNLNVTTDNPAELLQLMKLAGVLQGAEEIRQEPATEEFANTPAGTNERNPRTHGDIRDWGLPGTAKAKTHYTPAQQGDNPLESKMFEEYNKFKTGK